MSASASIHRALLSTLWGAADRRHQQRAAPLPSGHEPAATSKLAWHRGAAPMTIIDSQVHAYEANTPKRPWHSVPNWPDHVTGDGMAAAMDKVGADGALFISAFSMYRCHASYALGVHPAHPPRCPHPHPTA